MFPSHAEEEAKEKGYAKITCIIICFNAFDVEKTLSSQKVIRRS